MTASKNIDDFLTFLRDAEQRYAIAQTEAEEAEQQSQDIFHAVEFGNYNARKTASLVKKLQAVRQKRRKAKDASEILRCVVDWIIKNSIEIRSLERLLGDVRKVEQRIEGRIYTPRTNILEDCDERVYRAESGDKSYQKRY